MKGCLKLPSRSSSPGTDCSTTRKCVAFGAEGTEEVFIADEWDRTPTEPARKLSYQDLLELKEIQRSLPFANQPPDPLTGKQGPQYLSNVPVPLLPLVAENSTPTGPPLASRFSPSNSPLKPWQQRSLHAPQPVRWCPPTPSFQSQNHTQQLPARKPKFTFLPLLETPPSSASSSPYASNPSTRTPSPDADAQSQDPPTPSLTNASLDSSPHSRASSTSSPEPPFFQLPPRRYQHQDGHMKSHYGSEEGYFPPMNSFSTTRFDSPNQGRSRFATFPPPCSFGKSSAASTPTATPTKPKRRRNVIMINDMEIELDDDDADAGEDAPCSDQRPTTPTPTTTSSPSGTIELTDAPNLACQPLKEEAKDAPNQEQPFGDDKFGWRTSTPQLPPKELPSFEGDGTSTPPDVLSPPETPSPSSTTPPPLLSEEVPWKDMMASLKTSPRKEAVFTRLA
ncbi:hypothetical protein AX16_003493 [Volvariella volvacea WC 439]|nr:hypothetical protein AX16_003493 [Volvariella volvacea WC 439]